MSKDALPSALRSCPFCGGGLLVVCETTFEPESRPAYAVACRTKQCAGCVYSLGFGEFPSRAEAIAAWNRRAPDPVRAELLVALKVARKHVVASQGADHMWDGFGPRSHQRSDDELAMIDAAIAKAEGRVAGAPSSPAPHEEGGETR